MGSIFLIIIGAGLVFVILTLLMKKTDPEPTSTEVEVRLRECGICHEEFSETDMIVRKVGDAGYTRWFCDRCIIELYEESRQLHDPRSKE